MASIHFGGSPFEGELSVDTRRSRRPRAASGAGSVSPIRRRRQRGARRRPKHTSLHSIKGYAAWARRAEEALVRRELAKASPVHVAPGDDTLAPIPLRTPDEGFLSHGAPLAQRMAAEAAVEEIMGTVQHSAADAALLASLGGTLRSAVAPPDSFRHGEASTVRGGSPGGGSPGRGGGDTLSMTERALGGPATDAAMEAWVAAAARGEAPPEELAGGHAGGEVVHVGGMALRVHMDDSGLTDVSSGAALAVGGNAHKRKAAVRAAVAQALTTADGRPPWNHDSTLPAPHLGSGHLEHGVPRYTVAHDSSHKFFDASGRTARGPLAFLHPPSHAGRHHPLRPTQVAIEAPRLGPQARQAPAAPAAASPPAPPPAAPDAGVRRLAAAARRGSVMPAAGGAVAAAALAGGSGDGESMDAIAEEGMSEAQYYAALYRSLDAPSTPARRPPPVPSAGAARAGAPAPAPAAATGPPNSSAAPAPSSPPARVAARLSALARARRAVRAALAGEAYLAPQ